MKTYKLTVKQKEWIKFIYPRCTQFWRNRLIDIYFQSRYTSSQQNYLNRLRRKVINDPALFSRPLIPLKEYL